jgi:hypothetical protein
MDLEFNGLPARGLRRYVRLVGELLGLSGPSSYFQLESPVTAYLALEGRTPDFPDHDVALLWDEKRGWAAAIESQGGSELITLSYLGTDVLSPPQVVARFARQFLAGDSLGRLDPLCVRSADTVDDLPRRLAGYAATGNSRIRSLNVAGKTPFRPGNQFSAAAEYRGRNAENAERSPLSRGARTMTEVDRNIYSRTAAAFDPFDEGLLRLYTTAAITNARRWQQSRDKIAQLETALTSRAEIDQAKGILMALHGCTADEAFARMAERSQHTNIKVRTLARDLLASVRTHDGSAAASK